MQGLPQGAQQAREATKVCALKLGGDFGPEHVQWLAKQVPVLVCISDTPVPGVKTIKPEMDLPGWWIKMNAFSPNVIQGDVLLIDLDTVVLRMPDMPTETTVLPDWTRPDGIGSGFMFVTQADRERVWAAFNDSPVAHMQRHRGDQDFLLPLLGDAARWGDNVRSYKQHCRAGVPQGTDVVTFHGKPRPWAAPENWIAPLPYDDFRDLILKHKGKRICVMGGAPSLADDLAKVDADVYISANERGVALREPDYVLAMDEIHRTTRQCMGQYLRERTAAPIISPHAYADIRLGQWPQQPRWVLSGMVAIWAAFMLGAKSVIVAGCDAFGGDPGYVDEARKIARDVHCPVRVVSGPLAKVWPLYDPAEKFGRYRAHSAIDGWLGKAGKVQVRVRRPCTIAGMDRVAGEVLTAWRHKEIALLLKHRMIEEV